MIRVIDRHPGTRLEGNRIEDSRVRAEMLREPMTRADWTTHDYNVHFCIGIENTGSEETATELSINGGDWDELPETQPLLYTAREAEGPFLPADIIARTDLAKKYAVRFRLGAGEKLFVANTLVREPNALGAEFDALGGKGGAQRRVIGTTVEGREIVAFVYGDPTKNGAVLVTSGFHPPEPDTLASASIMDWLSEPEGRALTDRLAVAVVPIANPDGYALGTQGANASGINFYWHFARELPELCPEAAALWQFAEQLAPIGYIDFHSYTFQLRKQAGPYLRPLMFHASDVVRRAAATVYQRLSTDMGGSPVTGFVTYAPHTLGAMLTARFDTIALAKYHLHLAEGEAGCRERGLAVFRTLTNCLIEHGLVHRGRPRTDQWRRRFCHLRVLWAGLLRPMLGHLRRGEFSRIKFSRMALVNPGEAANLTESYTAT